MENFPRIHIVLLNWNGWQDSIECLESVFNLDYPNFQVVLCDNDSQDNSIAHIESWARGELAAQCKSSNAHIQQLAQARYPKPISYQTLTKAEAMDEELPNVETPLVLIQTGANLGFAGGNNVGLQFALNQGTEFCWLLNNDTVVEPDALREMVLHSKSLRAKGVKNTCGSVQCFYDDPEVIQALGGFKINRYTGICSDTIGRYLKRKESHDHEAYAKSMDTIQGCSWLLPREFLLEIGLMEHAYFLYFEEIDWVTRAQGTYSLTYAPGATVYHKEGSSIGSKSFSSGPSVMAEFYTARARLMYMKKFYSQRLPLVYTTLFLQMLNRIRQRRFANAKTIFQILIGKRTLQ